MGVDVDRFDSEVDKTFICSLCAKVLENPVSTKCGHVFCNLCLQKLLSKRRNNCPSCDSDLSSTEAAPASSDLVERLGKLSIHCQHHASGCETVLPFEKLGEHMESECVFRAVNCQQKGCSAQVAHKDLEAHMEQCEYRLVECKVCKVCVPFKDMPAHQAVKRCFEQLNRRRMVKSARRLSQELREHRIEMVHQRHLTDQAERRLEREHYGQDNPRHKRAMSAGPILMRNSVQTRVGSAVVVPHYSRNLKSATLESCRECTNKFTAGRRPSARRHSHSKCDHCQHWRRWSGPRGWASVVT